MANRLLPILLLGAGYLLGACTSFHERYYVRAQASAGAKPMYYRVDVSGWAMFSKSRFSAGLYDRRAVDALFGEVTLGEARASGDLKLLLTESQISRLKQHQELVAETHRIYIERQREVKEGNATPEQLEAARVQWETADAALKQLIDDYSGSTTDVLADSAGNTVALKDQAFVLFFTANNEALAGAIQELTESAAAINDVSALLTAEKRRELAGEKRGMLRDKNWAESTLVKIEELQKSIQGVIDELGNPEATIDFSKLKQTILEIVTVVVRPYGGYDFTTFEEARAWLEANRARILGD